MSNSQCRILRIFLRKILLYGGPVTPDVVVFCVKVFHQKKQQQTKARDDHIHTQTTSLVSAYLSIVALPTLQVQKKGKKKKKTLGSRKGGVCCNKKKTTYDFEVSAIIIRFLSCGGKSRKIKTPTNDLITEQQRWLFFDHPLWPLTRVTWHLPVWHFSPSNDARYTPHFQTSISVVTQ